MNTTYLLLALILLVQLIILIILLKPFLRARYENMSEDKLYKEISEQVQKDGGKVSTSLLQRRYSLGYARASRLMDRLREDGVIDAR